MEILKEYLGEFIVFLGVMGTGAFGYLQTRKPKVTTAVDVTNNLIDTVNRQLDRADAKIREVEEVNARQRKKIEELTLEIARLRKLVPDEQRHPK